MRLIRNLSYLLFLCGAAMLFAACGSNREDMPPRRAPAERLTMSNYWNIDVVQDTTRGVTCYLTTYGISCLKTAARP